MEKETLIANKFFKIGAKQEEAPADGGARPILGRIQFFPRVASARFKLRGLCSYHDSYPPHSSTLARRLARRQAHFGHRITTFQDDSDDNARYGLSWTPTAAPV